MIGIPSKKTIDKASAAITDAYNEGFNDGRHSIRDDYKESGLLILNPDANWKEVLIDPCDTCPDYNSGLKIGCTHVSNCEKYQKYFLAWSIYNHFK